MKFKLEQLLSDKVSLPEYVGMQLIDIIPVDQLQPLQDEFSSANGVSSVIFDLEGKTVTKPSNLKIFCTSSFGAGKKCVLTDKLLHNVNNDSKQCRLHEASKPIYICGKHVADWKIAMCGFGGVMTPFLEAVYGESEEKYNELYDNLSEMITAHFNNICAMLNAKVENISEIGYINMRLARKLQITKEYETKLTEDADIFQSIFENSIDGIILVCEKGIVREWSRGYEEISGILKEEVIGKHFRGIVRAMLSPKYYNEDEIEELLSKTHDIFSDQKNATLVRHIYNRKTQQERITKTHYFPVKLSCGSLMVGATIRDITDEMEKERELIVEKERLQALGNHIPDGVLYQFVLDLKTNQMRMAYVSEKWEEITGVAAEKAMASVENLFSKIHPDDLPILLQHIDNSAKNLSNFDCEVRTLDTPPRWLKITTQPYLEKNIIVWNGLILDETKRKTTEIQLEEYRNRLEFQVKERTEQLEATSEELYATNEELYATNEELHNKNFKLQEEKAVREEILRKLEDSESKMRNFIDQSFVGITIIDEEGKIIEWNPEMERITGYLRKETIGCFAWDIFKACMSEESIETVNQYRDRVLSFINFDNLQETTAEFEYTISHPGEEDKYIQMTSFQIALADKCYVGEMVRDITYRKLVENELALYQTQLEEMVAIQTRELTVGKERLISLSNNLPGGVIYQMSNKDLLVPQFTYISAYFEEMFDTKIEDVMEDSSRFFRLLHPEDGARLIDLLCSSNSSSLVDVECRIHLDSGESKWVHLRWTHNIYDDGTHLWDGFIIDITDRKIASLALDETRRHQNILIKLLQIIQSTENIHEAINIALAETGKFANVSRSYIFEKIADGKAVKNTYEWCNEGINPEIDNLQEVPVEYVSPWFDAFAKGEYVCTSDIATLTRDAYEALETQGIKSILVLPLTINGVNIGFVGFDECTHHKEWQRNEVNLIISLSQIISSAIRRHIDEKSITLSQQTMRTVLDNIDASIYVADFNSYEILFANKTVKDMIGKDLEGKLCWQALQGQTEPCDFCPKPQLLDNMKKPTGQYRWENKNQKLDRWFECTDSAIEWVDGRIVHMEYATDITVRRAAEEAVRQSEELYRQLTVASPDAIIVCDTKGKIIYLSPKAKELFFMLDDISTNHIMFEKYVHPHDVQKARRLFTELLVAGKSVQPQLLLMREDGSDFFGEISSAVVADDQNNVISAIMVIRDITERRMNEMELIRAKEKAEESDKLKSAFLANMSHEIRTPLNGINGFLSFIADENLSSKRRQEYVAIVHNSSTQLIRIIDDIIDIAKIEAQQLTIRPMTFRLNEFMRELHTFFETFVRTNKHEKIALLLDDSHFITPGVIFADLTRLRQVLTNLIGNAAKFTEKGYIMLGYRLLSFGKLEFWVEDTGIGLPENQQEVIFERFRQVELSDHRKYGGTGLGLTISRSLVYLMGGTISVESVEGEGSTFRFTISYLPVDSADEPVFADPRPEKPEEDLYFPGTSILIVEHEMMNAQYYEKILTYNGATLIHAQSVIQWIEAINKNKNIDLALVDARVFKNEDSEAIYHIRSMRARLPMVLIVPERNEYYNHIITETQCDRVITGTPGYEELCEELMRCI